MLDGIPIATLTALTPPALLGIAVLMLMLGRLVPRATLTDKIAEAEKWRLAYEAERKARVTSDAQTVELLELAKTTHSLLVAIFGTAERKRPPGEAYVVPTQTRN